MKKIFNIEMLREVPMLKISQQKIDTFYSWATDIIKKDFPFAKEYVDALGVLRFKDTREDKDWSTYIWPSIPFIYYTCIGVLAAGHKLIVYNDYLSVKSYYIFENEEEINQFIIELIYSRRNEDIHIYMLKGNLDEFLSKDIEKVDFGHRF